MSTNQSGFASTSSVVTRELAKKVLFEFKIIISPRFVENFCLNKFNCQFSLAFWAMLPFFFIIRQFLGNFKHFQPNIKGEFYKSFPLSQN